MFAGLDYGTSNSALGTIANKKVELIKLFQNDNSIPSTIYTLDRNLVCEYVFDHLPEEQKKSYQQLRAPQLNAARASKNYLGIEASETTNYFGKQAIEQYISSPEEGVFIKSPKSFLGASGLSNNQVQFFEDLVTAMLLNIKNIAEAQLQDNISNVVIGRPVNFHGIDSQRSNQQALTIMTTAAQRVGFKNIEYLYEPIAAGIDFESGLNKDKTVLVVDIGGGTTDCSMVKMGPSFIKKVDRSEDFLAHTGQRIGGNDLDIQLAYHQMMPLFGLNSEQIKGIKMPTAPFWSAVSTNNVGEQAHFTSSNYLREIKELLIDAQQPQLIERLIYLQQSKQNHRLIRSAETTKIALSECTESSEEISVDLSYIEANLNLHLNTDSFENAIEKPLNLIKKLISEALIQSNVRPDIVYITGGTAKSPSVRKAVQSVLPDVVILDGDYYGSVAAGLTKWADKIWQ